MDHQMKIEANFDFIEGLLEDPESSEPKITHN